MFDIGFWELAFLGLIALLVIGPDRLPGVARTAGLWMGRGRRLLSNLKAEIDREIKADEMKKAMEERARSNPLGEAIGDTMDAVKDIKREVDKVTDDVRTELDDKGTKQNAPARSDEFHGKD